ncbi:acyltransferase [soil metagenome]
MTLIGTRVQEPLPEGPVPRPPARSVRLPELDVIRVVASLVVVLWHLTYSGWAMRDPVTTVSYRGVSEVVRYGFVMPQVFFLISGLVIMGAVQRATPWGFFRARVVRLVPMFWLMCTITWLVSRHNTHFAPLTPAAYGLNMTFLTSFAGGPFIDAVYWTLTVEIAFYGTVWLALCSGQLHRLRALLLGWLLVGLVVELSTLDAGGALGHLGFLMRWNCCFAAGVSCWLLQQDRRDRFAWTLLGLCSLLAFRSVYLVADEFNGHLRPGEELVPWVGGIVLLVLMAGLVALAVHGPTGRISASASARWAVAGALTYPVYLLHENVGLIAIARFDWMDRWVLLAVVLGAVVAVSWLAMELYERPIQARLKRRPTTP